MLVTQRVIDRLAERIERAYRLRRPRWQPAGTSPGAWAVAASMLSRLHQENPDVPLDPELFVAAQQNNPAFPDPWVELTQPDACRRYAAHVRRIVRGLRAELAREVARAERRVAGGESVQEVLTSKDRYLSAMGRFIAAQRAGRPSLAARFRRETIEQHRSCPLYRLACSELLPPGTYPLIASGRTEPPVPSALRRLRSQTHLN